jgi:hypothetical protein
MLGDTVAEGCRADEAFIRIEDREEMVGTGTIGSAAKLFAEFVESFLQAEPKGLPVPAQGLGFTQAKPSLNWYYNSDTNIIKSVTRKTPTTAS